MSNLYDTFRWKTLADCRLLAFAMLPPRANYKKSNSTCDAPLYISVKLGLISTVVRSENESDPVDGIVIGRSSRHEGKPLPIDPGHYNLLII